MAKYPWETTATSAGPTKLTGATATDVNLFKNIIGAAQGASTSYDPKTTGFLNDIFSRLGASVNAPGSEKGVAFRGDIADIRTAIRNYISGAAIPKAEAKEFLDLIPKTGESDTKVKEKLRNLQEMFIRKTENAIQTAGVDQTGKEYLGTDVIDPNQGEQKKPFNLIDFLKNTSSYKTAQDIGLGAGLKGKDAEGMRESQANAMQMAQKLTEKAKTVTDPVEKQKLLKLAGEVYNTISGSSQEIESKFSDDIDKPYLQRSLESAAEIATAAEIPGLAKGVLKTGVKGLSAVKNANYSKVLDPIKRIFKDEVLSPKYTSDMLEQGLKKIDKGSSLRTKVLNIASEKGIKVDGKKIVTAVNEWATRAKRAYPTKTKAIDTYVSAATKRFKGKKVTVETIKQLWDDADKGFSAAGMKGSSIEGGYHRTVRDATRKLLEKAAPGFEKGTGLIREGLTEEKILKTIRASLEKADIKTGLSPTTVEPTKGIKFLRTLLKGGATAGATALILSKLGIRSGD